MSDRAVTGALARTSEHGAREPQRTKEHAMNWDFGTLNEEARLTPREAEVLRLIARGCTYARVADQLGISEHTVRTHVKNTYRKLGVRSGAAAVMRAIGLRLLAAF
jgi:DNA-binding CsgD family transcriptional regulator